MKGAAKINKPNQLYQSYINFLSAKYSDRTLIMFHQLDCSYLTNPTGGRT
jgi:hypothetical protein